MNTYPITVINDPANITDSEIYDAQKSVRLCDWLIEHYGNDGFHVPTQIFKGSITELSEIDLNDFDELNKPLSEPIFIIHRPLGFDPFTVAIIVSLVVSVAVALLMPTPDIGDVGGRQAKRSPNNALSSKSNVARLLDRVPEIFGTVTSYPDLLAPTVTEFIDHIKFQREYLCVGRGFYDLQEFRSGETLISGIVGSSVEVFKPGETPPEVLKTRQSNEVAGQELLAPDDKPSVDLSVSYTVTYDALSDKATITAPGSVNNPWEGFNDGDSVDVIELYATLDDISDDNFDGAYVIDEPTATELILRDAAVVNASWTPYDGVTENVLTQETGGIGIYSPEIKIQTALFLVGPFVIPGSNNFEVWVDLQAPKGLAQGSRLNKTFEVEINFLFEQIDDFDVPTGSSFSKVFELSEKTTDPRFWTFKLTTADGFVVNTRYRATCNRITNTLDGSSTKVDQIRWTRLAGIENITVPDTTGTTRLIIETQATEQVAAIQDRKFNVLATRETVTWDGFQVVGDIETGENLVASRRMADAFLHYFLDPALGARSISGIDVQTIFDIQDGLDAVFAGEKGEFSFTFDGKNTPALEELRNISQSARCFVFREGSIFSMVRDEAQPVSRGLFNRRNKLPNSESRAVNFNRPLDHDGVKIEYNDIEDGAARVIELPNDLPASDPNFGLPSAKNPLKIDGIGIRQYSQAWDRAQYEFNKLIYQRVSVESSVSGDGILLPLNSRIQHVDGTRLSSLESNGEIKTRDGLIIKTSERCIFESGLTYSVILRDEGGGISPPIIVTALEGDDFGFVLSSLPVFDIFVRGDNEYQRGTLYSFGPDGNELAASYLVQRKIPDQHGNVTLELVNYAPEYYQADNQTPPQKA
jgi:hypothetical protein